MARPHIDRSRLGLLLATIVGCSPQAGTPSPTADPPPPAAAPASVAGDATAQNPAPAEPTALVAPIEVAEACTSPCVPRTIFEGRYPGPVIVDAKDVMWIQNQELHRAPRTGGAREVLAREVLGEEIALDDDAVFVCSRRQDLDRDVLRVTRDGSSSATIATVGDCRLALSEAHVYVSARAKSWAKTLARVPKTGGTLQPIGPESNQLPRIVVDGRQVLWASDSTVRRFDETTEKVDVVVTDSGEIEDIAVTRTHVYWMRDSSLWRATREGGGAPERIANHQNALQMASDGERVYWASIGDEHWTRYDPAKYELQVRVMDPGPGSIAVHGSEVFVAGFGVQGRVEALETCACDASVLEPRPPVRVAEGPETEDELRAGWADRTGKIQVQVRDLSSDEARDVDALVASGDPVSLADERVPSRFRKGGTFRMTTTEGVFDAELVGAEAGTGGEGNHFWLILQGPASIAEHWGLVTRDGGPVMGPLRSAERDPDGARKVLAAVRKASDDAGHGRRVGRNHVRAVRGTFPAPHVYAVTVAFPAPVPAEDEESDVSAFFFTDADGNVTHEVFSLEQRLDTFGIDFLVDLGKDGTDEILFNSRYYEGAYDHLLTWDGAKPSVQTLSGDGA